MLFGDVVPSGKLSVSIPKSESDLPPFVNDRPAVTYGYLHGYRWLDAMQIEPERPFGFGLSYTSFTVANLRLDTSTIATDGIVHATVDVTNTGSLAGDEVVQLYTSYPSSAYDRAPRDLRAFARVTLAAGETSYLVEAGDSSRSLPEKATLTVR